MKLSTSYGFCLLALGALCLVDCGPLPLTQSNTRRHVDINTADLNRMLRMLQKSSLHPKLESRSITAFVTDPALLVTILHSLEIAYWTMPFGFILSPIINLFRMPNRRMDESISVPSGSEENARTKQFYKTLIKAITKIEKLNGKGQEAKSTIT